MLFLWRRHPDLNWGIRVLQTRALPLGYVAEHYRKQHWWLYHSLSDMSSVFLKKIIFLKIILWQTHFLKLHMHLVCRSQKGVYKYHMSLLHFCDLKFYLIYLKNNIWIITQIFYFILLEKWAFYYLLLGIFYFINFLII